jgi:hypothetical protein
VEAGDHDIGYRFRPAPLWIALHFMGRVTMLIWGLAAVIWPAMAARARARIAPPDTPVAITGSG